LGLFVVCLGGGGIGGFFSRFSVSVVGLGEGVPWTLGSKREGTNAGTHTKVSKMELKKKQVLHEM